MDEKLIKVIELINEIVKKHDLDLVMAIGDYDEDKMHLVSNLGRDNIEYVLANALENLNKKQVVQ